MMNAKGGDIMASVGKNIKLLRTSKNMTQDELAEKLFVSRQTVSNYETGKSKPDIDMLVKIAEAFGTDPNSLIYGIPAAPKRKKEFLKTGAAAGILVLLVTVLAILEPTFEEIARHYYMSSFKMLTGLVLEPCVWILAGWLVMQVVFLVFRIKPLGSRYIKWIHYFMVGILAVYFITIGPYCVKIAWDSIKIYQMVLSGEDFSYSSSWNIFSLWDDIFFFLLLNAGKFDFLFLIWGMGLKATNQKQLPKAAEGELLRQ